MLMNALVTAIEIEINVLRACYQLPVAAGNYYVHWHPTERPDPAGEGLPAYQPVKDHEPGCRLGSNHVLHQDLRVGL